MHRNLLWDVIQRQRGDIGGAVMECVTNSIEAGATRCSITIASDRITVEDDGRGFATRQEVEDYFEVFGKSDERKAESTRWAQFQMGRAQAWCWGRTTYRTRTHRMAVDLRNSGGDLAYTLEEGLEDVPGCRVDIELYDALDASAIGRLESDVARTVKYVATPVVVNGVTVSEDPSLLKWDYETEDAWVRFGGTNVAVYNLGAFVCNVYDRSVGATVVSKLPLLVNFARTHIGACPVWKRILTELRSRSREAVVTKKRLSMREAAVAVREWEDGELSAMQLLDVQIMRDTNGKHWSFTSLRVAGVKRVGSAARGSIAADVAMQHRRGVVFDDAHFSTVFTRTMRETTQAKFMRLARLLSVDLEWVAVETMTDGLDLSHDLLKTADLTARERRVLAALPHANRELARLARQNVRTLHIGRSATAEAWTDARNLIAFDRDTLRLQLKSKGANDAAFLLLLLAHEYSHIAGDSLTHDGAFHERFHKLCRYLHRYVGGVAARLDGKPGSDSPVDGAPATEAVAAATRTRTRPRPAVEAQLSMMALFELEPVQPKARPRNRSRRA